jgi:hypothetical protein
MSSFATLPSSATSDPEYFLRQLISGTQFERDEAVRERMANFGRCFRDVVDSPQGQNMMEAAKQLAGEIKDEAGFWSIVKICWR